MSAEKYFTNLIEQSFSEKQKDKEDDLKKKSSQFTEPNKNAQSNGQNQDPNNIPMYMNSGQNTPQQTPPQQAPSQTPQEQPAQQGQQQSLEQQELQATADNQAYLEDPANYRGNLLIQESDPLSMPIDPVHDNFINRTHRSLIRGFGKHVIGAAGDLVQLANPLFGSDIADGNVLSKYLQDVGKEFEEEYSVYMPEELQNPEFSWKTFANPDFWSGQVAEYIPQLVEWILISKGVGGAAKGLASKAAKKYAKGVGKEVLEKTGKQVVQNTTELLGKGGKQKLIELAGTGKGLTGGLVTTAGTLTEGAGIASEIVGGGLSMNLLAGMQNAGQLVNENRELVEQGLITEEELRSMAAGTVFNNMAYLPIDMLSWGITYGQATNLFGKAARSFGGKQLTKGKQVYNRAQQLAFSSKTFAKATRPIGNMVNRIAKTAGKPLFEGIEESFQETFEEWASRKAEADALGKEHDGLLDINSFYDFYQSKENQGTKTLSFALGMLGGMGSNMMSYVNKQAADNYKLWDRSENLKRNMAGKGRRAEWMQDWHVTDQMINNKVENSNVTNVDWLNTLYKQGVISEEQLQEKAKLAAVIDAEYDQASDMNVRGKVKYLQEVLKRQFYKDAIDFEGNKTKSTEAAMKAAIIGNPELLKKKLGELDSNNEKLTKALAFEVTLAQANINNLLAGKEATESTNDFVTDKNGQTIAIGLTAEQMRDYYEVSDEEIWEQIEKENKKKVDQNDNIFKRFGQVGKEVLDTVKGKFNKNEKTEKTEMPKTDLSKYKDQIINDDKTTELTPEAFQEFTDNNKVPSGVIRTIADKLITDPTGKSLSAEEQAVRAANTDAVNDILKDRTAQDQQTQEPEINEIPGPHTIKKNGKNYEVKNPEGEVVETFKTNKEAKAKLSELNQPYEEQQKTKKKKESEAQAKPNDWSEDPFNEENLNSKQKEGLEGLRKKLKLKEGIASLLTEIKNALKGEGALNSDKPIEEKVEDFLKNPQQGINQEIKRILGIKKATEFYTNLLKDQAEESTKNTEEENKQSKGKKKKAPKLTEKQQKLLEKLKQEQANEDILNEKQFVTEIYNSIYLGQGENATKEEIDQFLSSTVGKVTYGPAAIDQARHLNMHLRAMFPEQKIQAIPMQNLYGAIGMRALGYAVGSTILIDEAVWEQDEIFMHEGAHIYYNVAKDTPAVKRVIERVLANKPLLKNLLDIYASDIKFYNSESGVEFYRHQIDTPTREANFKAGILNGTIKQLPIAEQDRILEEGFVSYMQGPLSENFNKYFERKDEGRRQYNVKRFWKWLKSRGKESQKRIPPLQMVKALEHNRPFTTTDLNNFMMEGFVDAIKKAPIVNVNQMAMKQDALAKEKKENILSRRIKWEEQFEAEIKRRVLADPGSPEYERNLSMQEANFGFPEFEVVEDTMGQEELSERTADDLIPGWDKTFDRTHSGMGNIIINFGKKYAKEKWNINAKQYDEMMRQRKLNPNYAEDMTDDDLVTIGYLAEWSETDFKRRIMELAQSVENPFEFIEMLESSKDEDLKEFLDYLEVTYPQKSYLILRSAHMLYTNTEAIPVILHHYDSKGNWSQRNAFSNVEERMVESIMEYTDTAVLESLMTKLMQSYDPEIASEIIQTVNHGGINIRAILEEGYLTHEQKDKPIVNALIEGVLDENYQFDLRAFAEMIVNTNRPYSALSVVKDAYGNNISSRIISNQLTRTLKAVRKDLLSGMKKDKFFEKHGNSQVAESWWNEFEKSKILPSLTMIAGSKNEMGPNTLNRSYQETVPEQQIIQEILQFEEAKSKRSNTYNASMDIFGNSARRYQTNLYSHDNVLDSKGKITDKGKKELKALYADYNKQVFDQSLTKEERERIQMLIKDGVLPAPPTEAEFMVAMTEAIQEQIDYMNNHSSDMMKINDIRPYYTNNGYLTKEGKDLIGSFVYSRVKNTFEVHKQFNPGIPLFDIIKRNKGNISPVVAPDPNLRVELMMWTDERAAHTNAKQNDSGQYITAEDAVALQQAGMGVFDLNYGFKLFSHAVENKNKNFKGKAFQMKGYTTILSKNMFYNDDGSEKTSGSHLYLKPMYDILIERKAKYIESVGGNYDPVLGNGKETYMPILTPVSSEKGHLFSGDQLETLARISSLDALKNPENRKEYLELMDAFYYQSDGKFIGLRGDNLGPQQIMDKPYYKAMFGTQIAGALLAGATGTDLDAAIGIQQNLGLQKDQQLQKGILDRLDDEDHQTYVDLAIETSNLVDTNPLDVYNLKMGMMPYWIGTDKWMRNQMRKQFIRNGNQLRVPGTYAQTISDVGYVMEKPDGVKEAYINGTSGLQDYSVNPITGETTPLGVILPKNQEFEMDKLSLNDKVQTRKRQYFYGTGTNVTNKIKDKLKYMTGEFGLKNDQDIEAFIESHTITDKASGGDVIGYYIPGEIVMFTRIPNNGPSFIGMGEVVGFNPTNASNVMVPTSYKNLIGSDDDGDSLFVYKHGKKDGKQDNKRWGHWNKALDGMIKQWKNPRMYGFLTEAKLDFEQEINDMIAENGWSNKKFVMPFSPADYKENFNNSVAAGQAIGMAHSIHRVMGPIAAYGVNLLNPYTGEPMSIKIDDYSASGFYDYGYGKGSRVHQSSVIANIMMDSVNNHHAAALNLNSNTIGMAMVGVNLGFTAETIGQLFNHPAAIEYIEKFVDVGNDLIDTGKRGNILHEIKENNEEVQWFPEKNKPYTDIGIVLDEQANPAAYNSKKNRAEVFRLLDYLYKVNMDISKINKILSGHKSLEANPYTLEKQMKDFELLTSNKMRQQTLQFPDNFIENPEIQAYLKTAKEWNTKSKELSLVFNDAVADLLNMIREQITVMEMTDYQLTHFSEKMLPALYGRITGINNIAQGDLANILVNTPAELVEYMEELASQVYYQSPTNQMLNESELLHRLLFMEGMQVIDEEIVIMPNFESKDLQDAKIKRVRKEFGELPTELQRSLVIYDLLKHGWSGPKSISPLFSEEIMHMINDQLEAFQVGKEPILKEIIQKYFDEILAEEIRLEKNHFPKVFITNDDELISMNEIAEKLRTASMNKLMSDRLTGKQPFYFEVRVMSKNGRKELSRNLYRLNPLSQEQIKDLQKNQPLRARDLMMNVKTGGRSINKKLKQTYLKDQIELIPSGNNVPIYGDESTLLISNQDKTTGVFEIPKKKDDTDPPQGNTEINNNNEPPINPNSRAGMAYRTDYHNFTGFQEMDQQMFDLAMQYKTPISPRMRKALYDTYIEDKKRANAVIKVEYKGNINAYKQEVANWSDEKLLRKYKEWGSRNIYAYSILIMPVLMELYSRKSAEQSNLTKRYEDGDDIGLFKSYLMTNNIPSNHPATQWVQRYLETEFKNFMNERKSYHRRIEKVTEALYKEKLGLKPTRFKLIDRIKRAFVALFNNRQAVYEKLYGNIVELKYNDENTKKRWRLKTKIELDQLFKTKQISQAEFDFANMMRDIVGELHVNKKDFNTNNFVPAVGMSRLETFANKGLLGILTNSRSADEAMDDVYLNYEGQNVSFRVIKDIFRNEGGNNFYKAKEFIILKRKAKKLLKQGVNEDGSLIKTTHIQNITLMGDGFMNKFTNDGFVAADDLLSLDLNKALSEYVHTTLFVNGGKTFGGFLKLQAHVDALLVVSQLKGHKNLAKFQQRVYKEYFLKGKRLEPPTTLDKVIDTLTRANLLYIMGWKLFAVGKGLYVIGNAVVGKYHNVKNAGGKSWAKGESRFFGLNKEGPFGTRKAFGVLDTLNFMDINLYDTVNMEKASGLDSLITDIALMPMAWSEKWIQGTQFLGLLTDEQWAKFDRRGNYLPGATPITAQEITEIENKVKASHGKGYTPTDQRMIQTYSWGKAMLQFSRFVPTMFEDRFAKKDIDIYGKEHIGSLRAVYDTVRLVTSGAMDMKQFADYRKKLSPEMRTALDSGLRGMAITTLAAFVGSAFNVNTLNEMTMDANMVTIPNSKLGYKLTMPSMARTTYDSLSALVN